MTSIPSTTASSVSSLDTHPDSRPTVSDLITPKLWNQRDPFRLTTANIRPTGRVLDEIPFSLHALSFTSGVESELYQSWPPVGQTVTNGSWTAPQSEKPKSGPAIYSTPNASSQRAVSSNSANSQAQLRELWYKFFLNGCWSNARSDFYAACLVYHGPWTDKSTSNLLAEMFRAQYTRAFTNPWVPNSGTSRIIEFLGVVEKQPKKGRGTLAFVEFRASVRQSALNTFHLSIDLAAPNVLLHSCYLGALFRHGSVCEADVLCALARIARLAKRLEYFQAFYYLLIEAGAELYSQPCASREIRQHAWVLRDTVAESDEPACSLRWYILVDELTKAYESRFHPF